MLGFLAIENTPLKGNYWLSDLVAALDWVRANIENFGGDKNQITLFGQSAGAAAVRALIASPLTKAKFARAIMQSCPRGTFSKYQTIEATTNVTNTILNETGCAEIECFQKKRSARFDRPPKWDSNWDICLVRPVLIALCHELPRCRNLVIDGTYFNTKELLLDGTGPK